MKRVYNKLLFQKKQRKYRFNKDSRINKYIT